MQQNSREIAQLCFAIKYTKCLRSDILSPKKRFSFQNLKLNECNTKNYPF